MPTPYEAGYADGFRIGPDSIEPDGQPATRGFDEELMPDPTYRKGLQDGRTARIDEQLRARYNADGVDVVILTERGTVRAAFPCLPDVVGRALRPFLPASPDADTTCDALQEALTAGADTAELENRCGVEISPHDPARWEVGSTWLKDRI